MAGNANETTKLKSGNGGHRRYKKSDIFIMMDEEMSLSDNDNVVAVYCRVSSGEQK